MIYLREMKIYIIGARNRHRDTIGEVSVAFGLVEYIIQCVVDSHYPGVLRPSSEILITLPDGIVEFKARAPRVDVCYLCDLRQNAELEGALCKPVVRIGGAQGQVGLAQDRVEA